MDSRKTLPSVFLLLLFCLPVGAAVRARARVSPPQERIAAPFDARLQTLKEALDSGTTGQTSSGVLDPERLLKQLHQMRREARRSLNRAEFKTLMSQIRRLRVGLWHDSPE